MSKNIVLAHGILGFGDMPFVNYFNGVAEHLRAQGHKVLEPSVPPLGSIAERGKLLADAIRDWQKGEPIYIIAHSMGGLDARHAINHEPGIRERVLTLVTLGTPHKGSPVADQFVTGAGQLLQYIPEPLANLLRRSAPAIPDLTTAAASRFDISTPYLSGTRYIHVAGDALQGGHTLLLFKLAQAIGRIPGNVINDGVVTQASALFHEQGHENLADWPVDHAGLIGWSVKALIPGFIRRWFNMPLPHIARYDEIVAML